MKHGAIGDILMWVLLGSLAVLIVLNRKGFSSAVSSVSQPIVQESQMFTGAGYAHASGAQFSKAA